MMEKIINFFARYKSLIIFILAIYIVLLVIIDGSIAFIYFTNNGESNDNNIESGYISMSYVEQSNKYIVRNALPMKDALAVDSEDFFEFSVTTTVPTKEEYDNDIIIPYEITIMESEENTLPNDKIKIYITEVEGEKEVVSVPPTFISDFEESLYKDNQTKVGFKIHLHKNKNERITTKYRLRVWIDYGVDIKDWTSSNMYEYKFRVNVNGEATYQGYETDLSCFTYEKNDRGTYSITGYKFNQCGRKNIIVPLAVPEVYFGQYKEIVNVEIVPEEEFLSYYTDKYFKENCNDYVEISNCLENNGKTERQFIESGRTEYKNIVDKYSNIIGKNWYDYSTNDELLEYMSNNIIKLNFTKEITKELKKMVAIDSIQSFASTTDLNTKLIINGLVIPENITISNDAFSTLEIHQLIDRKGYFPSSCFNVSKENDNKIENYNCKGAVNVRIPNKINGIVIKTVSGFKNKNLKTVLFPDTIESIYDFSNNQLTSIKIPGSVKKINKKAFMYNKINNLVLLDGIEYIDDEAFSNNLLTVVTIPKTVLMVGKGSFYKNFEGDYISNPNLTKIINKTGLSFDWSNIIRNESSTPFAIGIINDEYGKVEIVAE